MLKVACCGLGVSQTHNLSVTSLILYHYYTTAPKVREGMGKEVERPCAMIFTLISL